jgi:hypothetical protein
MASGSCIVVEYLPHHPKVKGSSQDVDAGTPVCIHSKEYLRGKYHCTVDLLFDWLGISCMTTDNFLLFVKQTNPYQSHRRSTVQ